MKISKNSLVTATYDLKVGDTGEELELVEQATTEKPLEFIFGTGGMLESFEKHLKGLSAGNKFSFSLTPDETYGDYIDENIIELPKKLFEIDGKLDEEMLFEGNALPMMDSEGNQLMGIVVSVDDKEVTMDFNHPLAGETLHFDGVVAAVREATTEELVALHDSILEDTGCAKTCGSACGGCK